MRFSLIIFGLCTALLVSTAANEEQIISFWDMIPGIAQGKSLVQLIFGDKEGAVKTQEHFLNEGLGSSQLRSGYFLVTGEPKKALEIQKKFVTNLEGVLEGIPVVGHVKGGIHLLAGDHDHGWQAIKAATSTSGAIVGAMVAGPAGAVGGHLLTDALITATDIVLNGNQSQPHGFVNYVVNIDKLKPGEHFDALAGLVLDASAGKGIAKRKWFNVGGISHEKSAASYELQPLLKEKEIDNQRNVGMPKKFNTETEITEPKSNEPGQSESSHSSSPEKDADKLNFLKYVKFYNFLQQNPTYKDFGFYKLWSGEAKSDSVINMKFDGLDDFQNNQFLENLDIDMLKNKLSYLTDDEKSLIDKYDFRTINAEASSKNCIACSIAGIMKLNVKIVQRYIWENLDFREQRGQYKVKFCLESLKKSKRITYTMSHILKSIEELNTYLKSNAGKLENKPILLEETSGVHEVYTPEPSHPGHVLVLKFKMVKDNPEPVKMLFDYQYQGFLQPNIPNPFRFQTSIDTRVYNNIYIYDIDVLKQ